MTNEMPGTTEYDHAVEGLSRLGSELVRLIGAFLETESISIHSIDSRVKSQASVASKMASKQGRYKSVDDLGDLLGVRVIAYFADDVPDIVRVISSEFAIDEENSGDKQLLLDADRFGYLSHHLVAQLDAKRAELRENQPFAGRRFEIQVRSILQHAWAEIEHDLGYKSKQGVPDRYRRSFSRLASLLELADETFYRLRDDLRAYDKGISAAIRRDASDVDINKKSLESFVSESRAVRNLDRRVAAAMGREIGESYKREFEWEAPKFALVGITTIGQLKKAIDARADHVALFVEKWLERPDNDHEPGVIPTPQGISLFFLRYTLVPYLPEYRRLVWATNSGIEDDEGTLVTMVEETWSAVVAELGEPPSVSLNVA